MCHSEWRISQLVQFSLQNNVKLVLQKQVEKILTRGTDGYGRRVENRQ